MTIIPELVEVRHAAATDADVLALAEGHHRCRAYASVITDIRRKLENAHYALNTPSIARGKEARLAEEIERLKEREQGAWAALYAALGFPTIPTPTDS